MLKISVIGDAHIGAAYNLGKIDPQTQINTRLLDFANTFNTIIDKHLELGVSTVFLTGDTFETRHPTAVQQKIFSQCLQRAIDKGLEIIINVGNHDQQRNTDTTTVDIFNTLKINGIKVFQDMGVHKLRDDVNVVVMPYRDKRMLNAVDYDTAISIIRKEFELLTSKLKGMILVVGHFMFFRDDFDAEMFGSNELMLPLDMFGKCDAVVMGHIHKHQILSEDPLTIYSGSMEKVSFGEREHNKVSLILDIDDIKNPIILPTSVRNLYEIKIDCSEKEYVDKINNKIKLDLDDFEKENALKDSICKIIIKIKETDLNYIDQSAIKNYIQEKQIHNCTGIHVSSVSNRQLRNKKIHEMLTEKKAITEFINGLSESQMFKNKLLKFADKIIDEVEGK